MDKTDETKTYLRGFLPRAFAAWGEVAAEIDGRVERDIKAIREAA